MKTCVCDVCGQSLPMNNQLDATILGVALDLCPDCKVWASGMDREKMIYLMLEGFQARRINRRRDNGLSSPMAAMPLGTGATDQPPEVVPSSPEAWAADYPFKPSPPEVAPDPDPAAEAQEPASGIKGRYAPLKRAVLEALEKYRKENGAGCWQGLADEAGVTVEEIAGIRLKRKVPITVYESLAWVLNIREKGADA